MYCSQACYERMNGAIFASPRLQCLTGDKPCKLLGNGHAPVIAVDDKTPPVDEETGDMAAIDDAQKAAAAAVIAVGQEAQEAIAAARASALEIISERMAVIERNVTTVLDRIQSDWEEREREREASAQQLAEAQRRMEETQNLLTEVRNLLASSPSIESKPALPTNDSLALALTRLADVIDTFQARTSSPAAPTAEKSEDPMPSAAQPADGITTRPRGRPRTRIASADSSSNLPSNDRISPALARAAKYRKQWWQ
jgi:hypothetical protein